MKLRFKDLALLAAVTFSSVGSLSAQGRMGSIFNPDRGPIGTITDKTARAPGDLLTVMIRENLQLANQESTQLDKSTSLDYALTSFNLKPNVFNAVLPDVAAESSDGFTGTANYGKSGSFDARITAIVMDVHPNGNLVIEGRREIRVDNETKVITFSGIVSRYEISRNNTIESELVADARVSYVGSGVLTKTTNRTGIGGWLHSTLSWIWPF
jgi:flagellar L-ring protein precursor FlgH